MKLGLSIEIQEGLSYAETLALTRAAEDLSFETSLLAEHYYPSGRADLYPGGHGGRTSADAWVYLGALARDTSKIHLGTLVSPVTFRHPAVLAKMGATLDHVSSGRLELGIGAGWFQTEHEAFGFNFPPPPRRVDLVEEQLAIINGLWSQDPFTYEGQAYQLREAHFTPKPVQQPRPRIVVGGSASATRLPRLAARFGDEYVITNPSYDQCRSVRGLLDRECERLGRDPATLDLSVFIALCVAPTAEAVAKTVEVFQRTNPQYTRMLDGRENWIAGTPEEAQERLAHLGAVGIARALLSVNCDLHREMLPLVAEAALTH
ncbi:MAG: LLM class flavin-dependent oxidoreductase [Chloroflexi bacterium]|nr:LLM class flavin-dependent oxidoreductase [Chloroflexota bacterium]